MRRTTERTAAARERATRTPILGPDSCRTPRSSSTSTLSWRRITTATPTPVIAHAIRTHTRDRRGTGDGIVVTPSHNPPGDGGYKYNPPHGGPADTDVTGWIEREANALLEGGLSGVKRVPYEQALAG